LYYLLFPRRFDRLQELAEELKVSAEVQSHQKIFPVVMDVTDTESVRKAFAQAEAEVGTSNVIVNNSGIAKPKNSLAMDETDWYNIC
jgi:NADP-dependent 3-hydroxy acid dehydrogenase YdfG